MARERAVEYGWIQEDDLEFDEEVWDDGFLDDTIRKFIDEWRGSVESYIF